MADKAVSSLQDDDLEVLMKLARDKTVAGRKALVNAVSDLFFNNQEVLSDRERALMTDILRQIIHDVEMSVRRELAERLADVLHAPRELILTLANDEIEVAHRVLVQSDILHDMDLVEIIHHRTMEHQLVIAMRKNLNESVTDALVETGNEDVIKAMLDNTSARISKGTMEYLVDQSKRVDTYQNPLLKRPDLDPDLAKRMYWWVSAALRQHIIKNFSIDPAELDETLESSVKSVIDNHGRAVEQPKHVELVERLHEEGKVTPRMLLQVLRQGEVPLFEAMFGKLSGLRPRLLRRMMFEPGGEALAIVCRAIGIEKADFASIFMLTRKARAHERVMNPRELSRVLDLYDRVTPEVGQRMLKKWQRDASFLNAIRVLEASEPNDDK